MCTRSIVDSLVRLAPAFSAILLIGLCLYLYYINSLMSGTPDHVRAISPRRWTREELLETYRRLEKVPIDYVNQIPPRQNRRYIVVGGSGKAVYHVCMLAAVSNQADRPHRASRRQHCKAAPSTWTGAGEHTHRRLPQAGAHGHALRAHGGC